MLRRVEPVLQASSKSIVKIGKIGDAAIIKVATNMISAVTVQTVAEAYAIVKGSGIDPQALSDAIQNNAVRSGTTDLKLAKILQRDYDPHFSLKHMFKDVQLGIHIANALDLDLPATTATAGVMYGGLTRGWGDDDFSVLGRNYQQDLPPEKAEPAAKPEEVKKENGGPGEPPVQGTPETSAAVPEGAISSVANSGPAPAEPPAELPSDGKAVEAVKTEPANSERAPFIRRWFGANPAG